MNLLGLHHITAVTADAPANLAFYAEFLGMRLVKKTVNQDDVSAYHLFYADAKGTPGTDLTFFDWPKSGERFGDTDGIWRTLLRVSGADALAFWEERLSVAAIAHSGILRFGDHSAIFFEDPEGQRLALVDDGGEVSPAEAWKVEGIPREHAIRGLFGVQLALPHAALVHGLLIHLLAFTKLNEFESPVDSHEKVTSYSAGSGIAGHMVYVSEKMGERMWALAGGVHHVAFRVGSKEDLQAWAARLQQVRLGNSGLVDRFYFNSLYFRISEGILFELATDEPGFAADEDPDHLGEALALPPFLEERRAEIEAGLKPLAK